VPAYRISAAAAQDITQLLAYTRDRFGETARRRYEALLVAVLRDIASDPERLGSVPRPELGTGIRSSPLGYHLRHSTRRARTPSGTVRQPRHFLLYRITRPDLIGIGRVLHDGMEVERHLPSQYGDE
jgi:toxin ParE1/3/4